MDRRTALKLGGSLAAAAITGSVAFTAAPSGAADAPKAEEANTGASFKGSNFKYAPPVKAFLDEAERCKPKLIETVQTPLGLIKPVKDEASQLGWRIEPVAAAEEISKMVLKKGDSIIVDFGGHRTGNFSFHLAGIGRGVDAPARLRFVFGEVISDVAEPFHPYKGTLSIAWLPEETVNIDYLPQAVRMPRRYAFRFVKIEVVDTSPNFGICFSDLKAHALTSAAGALAPLPANTPDDLRRIDEVALATLRDCMQTTFEDGPRRDQRLWTGDLRLQALTSYLTYSNPDLVKRCLYLIAAFPRDDGLAAACVFEYPEPSHGHEFLADYSALFSITLADYFDATDDAETATALWPTATRQLEVLRKYVGKDNLFASPDDLSIFIDWHPDLDDTTSMQAVYIYALKRVRELGGKIGRTTDVADYADRIKAMEGAALKHYFDKKAGVFVSGPKRQVSLASQAWMTIAGVGTKAQRSSALQAALKTPSAIRPITPYLNHYIVEALLLNGLKAEALALFRAYWGGMVEAGADTFWEAYAPDQPRAAPYEDFHINSFCHAWSCTPSYLLRKYEFA